MQKNGTSTKYIPGSLKCCARGPDKIRDIDTTGIAAIGRAELVAHLQGKRLYASKAIRAFCYDCMGYYADGKADCRQGDCPLYPFMPYAQTKGHPAQQLGTLPAKNGKALDRLDVPKRGDDAQ